MKNLHIKKKNGEKKPHTNQKKIREKPILLKKKTKQQQHIRTNKQNREL